jgi:two-component system phosphate regulon sensor histidine kinase PhoR
VTFRARTFLGVFLASSVALAVATTLIERSFRAEVRQDIERSLVSQTRLAAALLSRSGATSREALDAEANALGRIVGERVTLIGANGTVLGDSEVDTAALPTLENHGARSEVVAALARGLGTDARRSRTTGTETLYAAVAVRDGPVAVLRVARPLADVDARIAQVRRLALSGLLVGLAVALTLIWIWSLQLARRLRAVADAAARYRAGDFTRPARTHGADELGSAANLLDDAARRLGAKLEDMARQRAHTDAILGGMAEGVLLVDATGRLLLTDPAGRALLRLPVEGGAAPYLERVRQPRIAAIVAAAQRGEQPAPVEVTLAPGARQIFVAQAGPVAAERGGGAVLVLRDITDLRRADQIRRDFVANVSHELRTPLTSIRGYVEALLDGPVPEAQAQEFLAVIDRHARRMERLVRDLLRLARLDAGQELLVKGRCSLVGLIEGVQHDLERALDARRLTVRVAIPSDTETVQADPAKLSDVLRNLIENATNYSPEDGVIDVTARASDDGVEIVVADRGPGIPTDDLPRIFERFYRVDRSRTRDPGGTGLGLSIVKHLVELHGGRVRAEARDGGGARFIVMLPAAGTGDGRPPL